MGSRVARCGRACQFSLPFQRSASPPSVRVETAGFAVVGFAVVFVVGFVELGEESLDERLELIVVFAVVLRLRPAPVVIGPFSTRVVTASNRSKRRLSCSSRSSFSFASSRAFVALGDGPLRDSPGVSASSIAIRARDSSW